MKISIITASYNYKDLISRLIESVISQTYTNWELIIVDDGSTDKSVDLIKKYTEQYDNIKLFQHEDGKNKGLKETIILGLVNCSGEYIAFLESDNYWEKNNLDEKIKILNKYPEIKFIFNDVKLFGDNESISKLNNHFNQAYKILYKKHWPRNILGYYVITNLISTFSCVMVKKEVLKQCDFNTPIDALLDIWLWPQILLNHDIYYIDKKLTNWMQHPSSYLNTSSHRSNKEIQKQFTNQIFIALKSKTKPISLKYIKLSFYQLLTNPKVNKIFRGLIRKLIIIME